MYKFIVLIFCCVSVSSTCKHHLESNTEYKLTIDTITEGGLKEWYIIKEQFINKGCNDKKKNASAYLCIRKETGDTVWVISPCVQNSYKKNSGAGLFIDDNVKIGDAVFINIPKADTLNFYKFKKVFGTLKIPYD